MDTIAAISTPTGAGAIGIVRMSGEQALCIALRFFTCSTIKSPEDVVPGMLKLGTFFDGSVREKCMMVYFRAPKSYTGEDIVEFHVHGGTYLAERVLGALLAAGAKLAGPGEFTRRAFFAGKLSLDEAEGVRAMISAESEAELREAYSLMSGRFDQKINALMTKLTEVLSTMEASLDYPEEMADEADDSMEKAAEVREEMRALVESFKAGKLIKGGITVAIVGKTNVGKSSLLNRLLGYSRAIVSDIHGTTRDIVGESILHKGVKINLQDTAGLRETGDEVEHIGIERSLAAAKGADVVLYVMEAGGNLDEEEWANIRACSKKVILVNNKIDIYGATERGFNISAKTGEGVDVLLDEILRVTVGDSRAAETLTEERHADCVRRALRSLEEGIAAFHEANTECVLVDLRESIDALAEIGGGTATERIINDIFSRFCVGK
ncbi:MAG TPA: tRNA uridine-5-carboxymethylaminomethyl(34) synthesis GTPase MnmE [Clostridiales bacterium]|nr:tRNA uridine-5-carboxymethylaminomethyl(34) synthesis GTPase MnmE [Clostridiales bacterium]